MSRPSLHCLGRRGKSHLRRHLIFSGTLGCVATIGALFSGCGNSAPAPQVVPSKALSYEGLTPPTTISELLKLVSVIGERRLWDRNDFYTEETLKHLFGSQKITVSADPGQTLTLHLFGFQGLLSPRPDDPRKFAGVQFFARKHINRPALPAIQGADQMFNYKNKRKFQAMIAGIAQGLDFKTVVRIFGPGWRENRDAENERFMAIAREPFNPPQPPPTGYMGNAIITYTTGLPSDKQDVSLQFDGEGMLREIDSVTLYEDP